jgi:cathepsin A (carboxypeptidase C)
VQAFVALFFETFSELKGRPLHFAGESYGGRYIPLFAASILDHNSKAVAGGHTPINLQSVMIGNGLTDELTAIPTYYDQACTNVSGAPTGPVLDIHTCALMQSYVPRCQSWLNKACLETHDVTSCEAAQEYCSDKFMGPFMQALWNPVREQVLGALRFSC